MRKDKFQLSINLETPKQSSSCESWPHDKPFCLMYILRSPKSGSSFAKLTSTEKQGNCGHVGAIYGQKVRLAKT